MRTHSVAGSYLVMLCMTASAEVITKCDGGDGYSYYIPGGVISADDAGWTKDGISKGSYLVIRDQQGFDVIFSDALGRTISSRDDGAEISVALHDGGNNFVLSVTYPGKSIELWAFELDATGAGTVTFHQARIGAMFPIRKHTVLRSACSR